MLEIESGQTSGKKVIEATDISLAFGAKPIVKGFDLRVLRGDWRKAAWRAVREA
jgi:ATP-binding cassette subfamily F protein uup